MNSYFVTSFGVLLTSIGYLSNAYSASRGDVLVIVIDDVGRELLSLYDTPAKVQAKTPNIDKLAKRGVTFENVWGAPLSAPARAAMLTGRYGYHTGIVELGIDLPLSETTIFEALPEEYATGAFGKWHLSTHEDFGADYGIDYFAGLASGGGVRDYYTWRFTENGKSDLCNEYITTKITDKATAWIDRQKDKPWFCWVAYNSAHTPYHLPPSGTYTNRKLKYDRESANSNPLPYLIAMIENLDYEIGRLLKSTNDETTIILIGDNGTDNNALQSPYPSRHGKGFLYESGVGIPMVVAGAQVTNGGGRSDALISAVDIFPTVMELTGEKMATYEDSYSFLPTLSGGSGSRPYNFSEIINMRMKTHTTALSDGVYKVMTSQGEITMMFNVKQDPLEQNNLLDSNLKPMAQAAYAKLSAELSRMNIPIIASKGGEKDPRGNFQQRGNGARGERGNGGTNGNIRQRGNSGNNNNDNSYNNSGFNNRSRL
ncbi:MAG: sulfatase-like hydrolase/transferase [Rikenellaceae bacterium]